MPWFAYHQNNSGGGFQREPEKGISDYVFIEAADVDAANEHAERIGLYFDGCAKELALPMCTKLTARSRASGSPRSHHEAVMPWGGNPLRSSPGL